MAQAERIVWGMIDGDQLVDLVLQHYDSFDSRYKGLLPLKRVYVPESLEESTSEILRPKI
jgi:restriction system protein